MIKRVLTMSFKKIYFQMAFLLAVFCAGKADAQDFDRTGPMRPYRNGDYAQAAELYEQSGEQDGTSAAYFYNLGNAYYKSGIYSRAILNYERSLLLDPRERRCPLQPDHGPGPYLRQD